MFTRFHLRVLKYSKYRPPGSWPPPNKNSGWASGPDPSAKNSGHTPVLCFIPPVPRPPVPSPLPPPLMSVYNRALQLLFFRYYEIACSVMGITVSIDLLPVLLVFIPNYRIDRESLERSQARILRMSALRQGRNGLFFVKTLTSQWFPVSWCMN